MGAVADLHFDLPAEKGTPREARRRVAAWLDDYSSLDELLVALSEVVTNAVLHAGTPVKVRLQRRADGRLRVEVEDGSPLVPMRRRFSPDSVTGRGLFLLDRLTLVWGVEPVGEGKMVWFEVGGDA
ncbi:MAG: ATP-binding protein [Acidimicrobiia bacterium]